jgi:hypothetical protein
MRSYNPDRSELSEVKLLALEPWRLYPKGADLCVDFLRQGGATEPRITKETAIASIGSCFAREIKRWLQENGYNFIETATGPCTQAGSARYDRVYNTYTIRQEFERAFGRFEPIEPLWCFEENGRQLLLDPYRKNLCWDDEAEMRQELAEHQGNVQTAFRDCDVLIITVGQAEIWYNRQDGSVYPLVPPVQVYNPEIHGFRLTTYQENLDNLERVYELFRRNNPNGRIIITVSPVPLRATFRQTNSIMANTASKSMLRAVVETFVAQHPEDVTYFPAYEIVTVLEKDPFCDDNRHVQPETVERIMNLFQSWFVDEEKAGRPQEAPPVSVSMTPPAAPTAVSVSESRSLKGKNWLERLFTS